jgi:predicted secreted protein
MKLFKSLVCGLTAFLALSLLMGSVCATTPIAPNNIVKNVKVGHEFSIVLSANPSTGSKWVTNYNPSYLKLVSQRYQPTQPIRVGSGDSEIFTYKALKPGETMVTFQIKYSSGFEPMFVLGYYVNITK